MAKLSDNDVVERYDKFKRFDTLVDHSDHLFSAQTSSPLTEYWQMRIRKEWMILTKDLPETIFVRVYESRMDLLRVAIIGSEGTPYHDGLLFIPDIFPIVPPLVRYHSRGLVVHLNVFKCGQVCVRPFNPIDCDVTWECDTSNTLQFLLSLQHLILISKPFFSEDTFTGLRNSNHREMFSLLYNENLFIKSLRTMRYIMNKPPKNFEHLVVGHFRKRATSILSACKAYTEGLQGRRFGNEMCSIEFKNDVAKQIKPQVAATLAEDFLHRSDKKLASLIAAGFA